MATYKDYQTLAAKIYDFGKLDENGKDITIQIKVENPDGLPTIWTKVALEKDAQGNATKFLETDNTSTGYYGAVYTNGKGEYILVNRGSDNLKNYVHDVDMWVNDVVPAEYADAKALMERAREYVTTNNGSLTITGHSLGGSISQLLSVEYGNSAVTFNPFNTQVLLDSMKNKNYNFTDLKIQSTDLQTQIDAMKAEFAAEAMITEASAKQLADLETSKQKIDTILGSEQLLNRYQPGSDPQNITNFMITDDAVSSHYYQQLGQEVRISVLKNTELGTYADSGAGAAPFIYYQNYWVKDGSEQSQDLTSLYGQHSSKNFYFENLEDQTAQIFDLYLNLSESNPDNPLVTEFLQLFKDNSKFEVDAIGGDIVRISQQCELYFMPTGATAKPASTELIGELYDPSYQQAVFAKAGTKADIETLANDLASKGATLTTDGNQIYVSYANQTLAYEDSANLANGGSVGADSIGGKDATLWIKVNDLSLAKDGYSGFVYTRGDGEYVLVSNGNADMKAYAAATELVSKIAGYLADNGGGQLDFVGFDEGGTLSQMLAVAYGGESYAFNPPSSSPQLNAITEVDQVTIDDYYTQQQTILDQLADKQNPPTNPNLLYQQLTELQQTITDAKINNQLYDSYHSGNSNNLYNYVIVGDSSYQQPQPGETISIQIENKSDGVHDVINFNAEQLKAIQDDIYITTNKGALDDEQEISLVELFKDKTKYEIDAMDSAASQVRVSQDHELYFGIISQTGYLMTTGNDRSQLITDPYDKLYSNVNLTSVGSSEEITQTKQDTINYMLAQRYSDGSNKYAIAQDQTNADKQSYLVFMELPPNQKLQQYDPLALDLNNDGKVTTVGLNANVLFDHDGDGVRTATGWVAPEDGLLVRDKNNDGQITSGSELFGDNTIMSSGKKAKNAFEALADFDSNQDGKIDGDDDNAEQLRVWQDTNQDGISQASELHTLSEAGISSINAHASQTGAFNQGNGNVSIGYSQFERSDGSRSVSGAFNFVGNPIKSQFSDVVDTSAVADLPNISGSGMVRDLREAAALSPELATALRNYADNQYPKDSDLEDILMLWAQTSTMDTIAATLKSGPHPAGARGTNLSTEEIQRLGVIEKFTGLYAGITNFRDPVDSFDGSVDGRYRGTFLGIEFSGSSINNSYQALLTEVGKNLATASGKDNVFNLIDYRLENGHVQQDLKRACEWIKSIDNHQFAVAQMLKLWDATNTNETFPVSAQDQTNMLLWLKDKLQTYGLDNNPYLNTKSSVLFGGENAELFGEEKARMSAGNDNNGDNIFINGGGGNDVFYIGNISNIIEGGRGDDFISVGSKNNVYVFNRGDGHDVMVDYGGYDTIYFGDGISAEDLNVYHEGDAVRIQIGDDRILLYYQNLYDNHKIEQFLFADGSRYSYSELILPIFSTSGNDLITGTGGNDIIDGKEGNDSLIGFGGNDTFIGGTGNDSLNMDITHASATAIFNRGDGSDTLEIINHSEDGEFVLQFGGGITANDLEFCYNAKHELFINYGDSGDNIYLRLQGSVVYDWLQNDSINGKLAFADGTVIDFNQVIRGNVKFVGSDGNDSFDINSKDMFSEIIGGQGNDFIWDWAGSNTTYVFNRGDGNDVITENSSASNLLSFDTIRFGEGISEDDLILTLDNFQLTISLKDSNDSISVSNYMRQSRRIEQLLFTDGVTVDLFSLVVKQCTLNIPATEGNDDLRYVTNGNTTINLYGGDDTLFANGGNNLVKIYAGTGHDYVNIDNGIYEVYGEDGNDTIDVDGESSGQFTIYGGNGDDTIWGTTHGMGVNFIYGGESNDTIFAGSGYGDILDGGHGDDWISCTWHGNNTYVIGENSGHDKLWAFHGNEDKVLFTDGIRFNDLSFAFKHSIDEYGYESYTWLVTVGKSQNTFEFLDRSMYTQNNLIIGTFTFDNDSSMDVRDLINNSRYVISGSAAADTIYMSKLATGKIAALEGDDTIIDDVGRDNTYVFGAGDGKDVISERGGLDSLILRGGLTQESMAFNQNNNDLVITFKDNSSDQITISNWFAPGTNQIEKLVIGANEYSLQDVVAEQITVRHGTSGNDHIELVHNQIIVTASTGDDIIRDTTTHDTTYVYNRGDGKDNINDVNSANDVIQFGENITAADLKYIQDDTNLVIALSDSEQITIQSYASFPQRVETLKFSDGSSLNLAEQLQTAGILNSAKIITSNDDDTLWLDKGATVNLREGNNKFYLGNEGNATNSNIHAGSGNDRIIIEGSAASNIVSAGNGDNFVLAKGLSNSITGGIGNDLLVVTSTAKTTINAGNGDNMIQVAGDNNTAAITSGSGKDEITIRGSGTATISSGSGDDSIHINPYLGTATVKAGDGDDIITGSSNSDKLYGGNGNDVINGNDGNDLIYGENGDDYLNGGDGNDTLISRSGQSVLFGEAGDDVLSVSLAASEKSQLRKTIFSGGSGNDTIKGSFSGDGYLYNRGDGKDTIYDYGDAAFDAENSAYDGFGSGRNDVISFGSNISIEDISFTKSANDLIIKIGDDNLDQITIKNHFHSSNNYQIEMLQFADGSHITTTSLIALRGLNGTAANETINGTAANDILYGKDGNDILNGGNGNDTISGDSGDDMLSGGAGNDTLKGGAGNDTYLINQGDGKDIIDDSQGKNTIIFGEGVSKEDLWFTQKGADVTITNTKTGDEVKVKKIFGAPDPDDDTVVRLTMEDFISGKAMALLIQDQARLGATPMAESQMSQAQKEQFTTAIGNSWMVDASK